MNKYVVSGKKIGDISLLKFKNLKILDIRQKSIANLCKGKKVLVIGCVDMVEAKSLEQYIVEGKHQFYNISLEAEKVVGVDINSEGIKQLRQKGFDVIECNILKDINPLVREKYDIVVVSHVIEHVPDIYNFIKKIIEKIKFEEIIFGVPNAYNIKHALPALLLQREQVSNDHYYTFTPVTFLKLLESLGIEIKEFYLDGDRKVKMGNNHKILGYIWSIIKGKYFKYSGDLIVIGKKS